MIKLNPFRLGSGTSKLVIAIYVVLALLLAGGYYMLYQRYNAINKDPTALANEENATIIASVGKLISLPTDETPTVATVLDTSKLGDQAFFKDAQNGDKILIYTQNKKAIVYRPSTNKLINVGPILLDQATTTPTQSLNPTI
jgi:hypothetical protein